jgi:amino acid adenylation domain-containing protein
MFYSNSKKYFLKGNNRPDPTLPLDNNCSECIHSAFTRTVNTQPQKIAVTGSEISISYSGVDSLSNRLANYLLANRAANDNAQIVALYAQRSPTLVWAILGILKAGAAFLILDAKYPHARLEEYCRQAEPSIILQLEETDSLPTEINNNGRIPTLLLPKNIADANQLLQSYSPATQLIPITPQDLAYISFTSGSTGRPKGILGNHAPVAHFIAWDTCTFELTSSDRFSMLSGLSHDVLLRDIFVPLSIGATICVPDELDISPGRLTDWLAKQQITVAHLTPSMGQLIAANDRILKKLRYLFFGGDKLTTSLVKKLCQQASNVTCVNFYGATETPQAMGFFVLPKNNNQYVGQVIPVGCGIKDAQLLIVDANLQVANIGEVGEIAIRTPYLTRGYLNDRAATEEKFISNPHTNQVNDLIYKSGDLGRYLQDGNVEFIGRMDEQIKLRGYRIELGEIEAVLNTHPSIHQSKVVMQEIAESEYLVGYIVTQKSVANTLRSYLLAKLPLYMVPSFFIELECFPLTPNGKVDTAALPSPQQLRPNNKYVPPRTNTEKSLAVIWEEVLYVAPVGIYDNFFELGGHSLLAIQVIARVRKIFSIELLLQHLFEFPTIITLAKQLSQMRQIEPWQIRPALQHPMQIPVSFAQQNLWSIVKQSEKAHAAFNIVLTRLLIGLLNTATLRQSVSEVVRRHESLRTTFTVADGQPFQIVHPPQSAVLPIVEIQGLSEKEQIDQVRILTSQELQRPFDLEQGPLWRATLYKLNEEKHILSFTVHHIIFDAWSSDIFMDELWTLYDTFQQNKSSPLSPFEIQYKDFALWQHDQLKSKLKEGLEYWEKSLGGDLPILQLPYNLSLEPETFIGERLSIQLSMEFSKQLKEFSLGEGATLFITLLTALKVLLVRYINQTDILVGIADAGRHCVEVEKMIGLFAVPLPLRTDLSGNPTFREAISRIRQVTINANRHQNISFQKLLNILYPNLDMTCAQVFKVWVNMVNETTGSVHSVRELTVENISLREPSAKFDLSLYISDGVQVQIDFLYKKALFSKTHIVHFVEQYENLLKQIVSSPNDRIEEISFVSPY